MKELNLYPLTGLLMELQKTGLRGISAAQPLALEGKDAFKKANCRFWADHLADPELNSLITLVKNRYHYLPCHIPQFQAVLDNPDLFLSCIKKAVLTLGQPMVSEQPFFSAMECLTILCNLYSDFVYMPFRLTIDQGFLLTETDIRILVKDCLNPLTNPYFNFIDKYCRPVIQAIQPHVIWSYGPPAFSTFAMILMARKICPNVHICLIDVPSEYYSLTKIKSFLKTNTLLFSIIDSILLHDDIQTRQQILDVLETGDSLDKVPNLIHTDKNKNTINIAPTRIPSADKVSFVLPDFEAFYSSSSLSLTDALKKEEYNSPVIALKMWDKTACYWNKCTFCGINQKYPPGSDVKGYGNIDEKVECIAQLTKAGYDYFWMTDEAIPPHVLEQLARRLAERQIKVHWQARSRLDKGFTQQVCDTLARAGLKEIRFGLESASPRILALMNKFPDDFDLSLVETIVGRFHQNGVSVHLCLILDFPGETHGDRTATFDFLRHLKKHYPSLTFNLNRFMLDIKSRMFARYHEFDITQIQWPCPSKYFLGNMVSWDSENRHFHKHQIDDIRNTFMRQQLYPWMPASPMTPPFNFYVQYESFKMTLIWKTKTDSKQRPGHAALSKQTRIIKSDHIVYTRRNKKNIHDRCHRYQVYNWQTHVHFECNETVLNLYDIFTSPKTVEKGLEQFHAAHQHPELTLEQVFETYFPELEKAFHMNILNPVHPIEQTQQTDTG